MKKPLLKGFISYSHENKKEKDRLIKFLDVMEQENVLKPGMMVKSLRVTQHVRRISLKKLLLQTYSFFLSLLIVLASEGCKKELEEALKKDIKVIPILLEHCDWEHHQLSGNEGLPDKFKPISKWEDKSEGWQNVVDESVKLLRSKVSG